MNTQRDEVVVALAVLESRDVVNPVGERGRRVLIARRRGQQHLAGCWEFPGGKCEPGETRIAALHRELLEELGLVGVDGCGDPCHETFPDLSASGAIEGHRLPMSDDGEANPPGTVKRRRWYCLGAVRHRYSDRVVRLIAYRSVCSAAAAFATSSVRSGSVAGGSTDATNSSKPAILAQSGTRTSEPIACSSRQFSGPQSKHFRGAEGQWLAWVHPVELGWLRWPPANSRFSNALMLPSHLPISPDPGRDVMKWMTWVEQLSIGMNNSASGHGVDVGRWRQLQLRAPSLTPDERWRAFAAALDRLASLQWRGRVWLNPGENGLVAIKRGIASRLGTPRRVRGVRSDTGSEDDGRAHQWPALGWHLPEAVWRKIGSQIENCLSVKQGASAERALPFMVAVHDRGALAEIEKLPLRARPLAVTLGPVCSTQTHPGAAVLGPRTFARWVRESPVPVYALGGLSPAVVEVWQRLGAQGVAGIRAFWSESSGR